MPDRIPALRPAAFAVPGDLAALTGGTIYDARLIAGLLLCATLAACAQVFRREKARGRAPAAGFPRRFEAVR